MSLSMPSSQIPGSAQPPSAQGSPASPSLASHRSRPRRLRQRRRHQRPTDPPSSGSSRVRSGDWTRSIRQREVREHGRLQELMAHLPTSLGREPWRRHCRMAAMLGPGFPEAEFRSQDTAAKVRLTAPAPIKISRRFARSRSFAALVRVRGRRSESLRSGRSALPVVMCTACQKSRRNSSRGQDAGDGETIRVRRCRSGLGGCLEPGSPRRWFPIGAQHDFHGRRSTPVIRIGIPGASRSCRGP